MTTLLKRPEHACGYFECTKAKYAK
jgi:hypothetical protein